MRAVLKNEKAVGSFDRVKTPYEFGRSSVGQKNGVKKPFPKQSLRVRSILTPLEKREPTELASGERLSLLSPRGSLSFGTLK
jgi:hypothetical protein